MAQGKGESNGGGFPPARSLFCESAEQLQPFRLALLRMELRGEEIILPDGGTEGVAVVGFDGDEAGVFRYHIVRVDEVEEGAVSRAFQNRRLALDAAAVPPHVRYLELVRQIKADAFPAQDAQPFVLAVFIAHVEEELQPQADAQERLAGGDRLVDGSHQFS